MAHGKEFWRGTFVGGVLSGPQVKGLLSMSERYLETGHKQPEAWKNLMRSLIIYVVSIMPLTTIIILDTDSHRFMSARSSENHT